MVAFAITYFGIDKRNKISGLLSDYEIEDITERLQKVMRDSENDVLDKFKIPMRENIEYMLPKSRGLLGIFTSNEAKNETERLLYFASLVGPG